MRPSLQQLAYVVAIADCGSYGAAAEHLAVSQPSLSVQIAAVEAELGVKLFYRGRGGARPTPSGEAVIGRARRLLRAHQDLRACVMGGGLFQGQMRLGVLPSIGPYILPGVVRRLHQEHPSFRLVVREESTRDLDEGLRSGRFDLVISTPEDHPGMLHLGLFQEALWVAVALDHPLAQQVSAQQGGTPATLTLQALAGETLLTLGPKHRLSHMVALLAQQAGARVSDEYEGTSLDAIRLMAATGAGIAVLPHIYAATEARRGTDVALLALDAADARRSIALIQPLASKRDAAAKADIEIDPPQRPEDVQVLADILHAEAHRLMA